MYLLVLLNLTIFLIVALIVRRTRSVAMPFCEDHRNYRSLRTWMGFGVFLGVLGFIGGLIALSEFNADPLGYWFISLAFLAMLIIVAVISQQSIRALKITDATITLTNVNRRFKEELEMHRQDSAEEYVDYQ